MASEGDEFYLPPHMLEVIVEENNDNDSTMPDDILEVEVEDDNSEKEDHDPLTTDYVPVINPQKRQGIPVMTTAPEERELYTNLFSDVSVVRYLRIHCSICDCHIGCCPSSAPIAVRHKILGVLVCKRCNDFYGTGDFPQGDDGSEIYCRWCGQGGRLICCSSCPNTFCKRCISQNYTKKTKKEFNGSAEWVCFMCCPQLLWEHRAFCTAVLKYIQKEHEDWTCGIENPGVIYGPRAPALGDDPSICCETPLSQNKTILQRRMTLGLPAEEKLKAYIQSAMRQKNADISQEKSLVKHLDNLKWVQRIKPRDISELMGGQTQTQITSQGNDLLPMVQIPTNTPPTHPPSKTVQSVTVPQPSVPNPYIPGITSVGGQSPTTANLSQLLPGRYLVRHVNNNILRLPLIPNGQQIGPKGSRFPNPMAILQCTTSQAPQLLANLTPSTSSLTSSNPKSVTKIAFVNGQMTLPNGNTLFYVNAGQKATINSPGTQQNSQSIPNAASLPSQMSSKTLPVSSNLPECYVVDTSSPTINQDDDICIVSSTLNESTNMARSSTVNESSRSARTGEVNSNQGPRVNIERTVTSSEIEKTSRKKEMSGRNEVLSQASQKTLSTQLRGWLQNADVCSRKMNSRIVLMKKTYKRLAKTNDISGMKTLAKRLHMLLKRGAQKISQMDSEMLIQLRSHIKTSEDKQGTVSVKANSDKMTDLETALGWDSDESNDSDSTLSGSDSCKEEVSLINLSTNENSSLQLRNLLESSKSLDSELKKAPASSNKSIKSSIKSATELQDNGQKMNSTKPSEVQNKQSNNLLKASFNEIQIKPSNIPAKTSLPETKTSQNSPVSMPQKVPNPAFFNRKRTLSRNTYSSNPKRQKLQEKICEIDAEWKKLIRPCSIVLQKVNQECT